MLRLVGATCLLFAIGCTTGDAPPEPNGRLCGTTYSINGTFAPGAAAPAGKTGCWPVGTWSFAATQIANDCGTPATLLSQYQIRGDQVLDMNGDPNYEMHYATDPANTHVIVKVSEGGSGLCEGELDIYSTDGKQVFGFKPELNADNTVTGDGDYTVYGSDQWPFGG